MSHHDDPHPEIGDLLRRARRASRLTQEELAEQSGLSARGISDLERGVRRAPHQDTLARLMDALRLSDAERRVWRQSRRAASARVAGARHPGLAATQLTGISTRITPRDHPVSAGELNWLAGRDAELAELERDLDHCLHHSGSVALLAGEPGIGKTRLAQQVAETALLRGAGVYWGTCPNAEGVPDYWPWMQIIRSWLMDHNDDAVRNALSQDAASIAQIVSDVRVRLPHVPPLAAIGTEQARFQLFDGVGKWLLQASRRQPLVLIFDDLHWSDAASLRLLQFVATRLHELRVLIVVTYRDFALYSRPVLTETLADLSRQPVHAMIHLHGLGESDVATVIERIAGSIPSQELALAIHRRTEGNPFFVTEIVRFLVSSESTKTVSITDVQAIPGSIRDAVRQRVSMLSASCQELLSSAAIIGRDFSLPVLAELTGQEIEQLLDLLDEAAAAHLIQEMDEAGQTRFVHALIRETLYADLGAARRMQIHARVAVVLEAAHANDSEPPYADIAYHYRTAAALGYVENAISYSLKAAEHAMTLAAWESAVERYQDALNLLERVRQPDARRHCELLLALGDAQNTVSGLASSPVARSTFAQAAELAGQLGAADLFARAALGFAGPNPLQVAGGLPQVDLLNDALHMLADSESILTVQVMARLATSLVGRTLGLRVDMERARALVDAAVVMARRVENPATLVYSLLMWHVVYAQPDDIHARLAATAEAIDLAAAAGDRQWHAHAHDLRCNDLFELGEREQAEQTLLIVERAADELGLPILRRSMLNRQTVRALSAGQYERADVLIQQRMLPPGGFVSQMRQLFTLRREQGRLEEIADLVCNAYGASNKLFELALMLIFKIETGRAGEAGSMFSHIVPERFQSLERNGHWLITLALHSEICHALGDAERGEVLYQLLAPYAARNVGLTGTLYLGSTAHFLGLLAVTCGKFDIAEQQFRDAMAMNERLAMPPYLAHTQHAYADMLRRRGELGDRERAQELVDTVLETADTLGMHSLRDRAVALGQQLSLRKPKVSPRERDVLRLLAEGYSNQEIAAALSISPHTVATHVTNILNKLGLDSRAAAAAWAVRQGLA